MSLKKRNWPWKKWMPKLPGWRKVGATMLALFILAVALYSAYLIRYQILLAHAGHYQDRVGLAISALNLLFTVLGGLILIAGAVTAYKNLEVSEKNLKVVQQSTAETLKLTQEKQDTERFNQAIQHLSSDSLPIRIGGIRTLERIAEHSPILQEYWPVMEVLTAFVRALSQMPEEEKEKKEAQSGLILPARYRAPAQSASDSVKFPADDIKAILEVLKHRKWAYGKGESDTLDLHSAYLQGAFLPEANLQGANLYEADLRGANLWRTNLRRANLGRTDLQESYLGEANLQETHLENANLENAKLQRANLQGADLSGAKLQKADLRGADLEGADLWGINLQGAKLRGADLEGAINLTLEKVNSALMNRWTKLPPQWVLVQNEEGEWKARPK